MKKIDLNLEVFYFLQSSMKNCIGGVILYDETIKQKYKKANYS